MAKSLNGWTVLLPTSRLLATGTVPGTNRRLTLRKACLPLFLALAYDYDAWVREIDIGTVDEGGYAYRQSNGSLGWSNHASGSAVDINWSKEGAQRITNKVFWSDPQHQKAMETIKKCYQVGWGGDWHGSFWDPMHFEISPGTLVSDVLERVEFLGIDANGVRHNAWNGKPLRVPRG